MSHSPREVLVVERAPELTAFFGALVDQLSANDVHLTIEPDAKRAAQLAAEGRFDVVIRDADGMLALVDQLLRAQRATAAAERAVALDNRW